MGRTASLVELRLKVYCFAVFSLGHLHLWRLCIGSKYYHATNG